MTALYAAAKSGCIASIEKIQEASSESQETFGENIKRLFEAGFEGKNALHVAAANNRANAFQKILSFVYHSVPVNSVFFKDNFGRTPVHYAGANFFNKLNFLGQENWHRQPVFKKQAVGQVFHF
jgi:ankyrin repeat protein